MKNQDGITILEALIALTTGSLIIMIFLYAVPTLQRNSRNNTKKNDISIVFDKLSSYQLNNSAALPSNASVFNELKLSYFQTSSMSVITYPSTPTSADITFVWSPGGQGGLHESNNSIDKLWIYNYRKCKSDGSGSSTSDSAGYRDVVALYAIETSSGLQSKCLQM